MLTTIERTHVDDTTIYNLDPGEGLRVSRKKVSQLTVVDLESIGQLCPKGNYAGKVVASLHNNSVVIVLGPEDKMHWRILCMGHLHLTNLTKQYPNLYTESMIQALPGIYTNPENQSKAMREMCDWIGGAYFVANPPKTVYQSEDFGPLDEKLGEITCDLITSWL